VLRGAGVALALPWLESLAPRGARGQAAAPPLRFVPVYFPMGAAAYWTPSGEGAGDAWTLSPILEPLAPVKAKVTVLSHVDNTAYGAANVEPMYPRETSSFLTCATPPQNGISIEEVIAQGITQGLSGPRPPFQALHLGLSTAGGGTEDLPADFSRTISWGSPGDPIPKIIDPSLLFDALAGVRSIWLRQPAPSSAATARLPTRRSVLDLVQADAIALQRGLGRSDRERVDQFLASVRTVEQRLELAPPPPGCGMTARPTPIIGASDYSRDAHAEAMIELLVLALTCNVTRVVSFMLDDARSDYTYSFLQRRQFTALGSTPGTGAVGAYRAAATASATNDDYATIGWWFASKLAHLCQRLAAVDEGNGTTALDNAVIWFGSGMSDGVSRSFTDLPVLYVGGGGGALKTGQHLAFPRRARLSDIYLTFAQSVFGLPVASMGDSQDIVPDLLA
jgi:hypothetical protein